MKIMIVTTTRADWGLIEPIAKELNANKKMEVRLIATGQHIINDFETAKEIESEGYLIHHVIDMYGHEGASENLASSTGKLMHEMGDIFRLEKPDLMLVLGDRYEILACALVSLLSKVPIVHVFGGDVTEGATDDSIRHAITKMSSIHFPSTAESANRILQLGEDPSSIFNVGSTGIDRILSVQTLSREKFFDSIQMEPGRKNFIVTFHPETTRKGSTDELASLLEALDEFPDFGIIFTGSNMDPGAEKLDEMVKRYVASRRRCKFFTSLGSRGYFSALKHCDVVIGNSSSGILEAPSFHIPTVNVGDRQFRRPRAGSIIDVSAKTPEIIAAIHSALELDCSNVQSPFGNGTAAAQISEILSKIVNPSKLLRKNFMDLAYENA